MVHCFQMCTFLLDGYISAIVATNLCFMFSLLGLQQGTLAEHYTSASPGAATNTNQVLSETDFLRRRCCGAQYNLENNNGRLGGAACSPDSEMWSETVCLLFLWLCSHTGIKCNWEIKPTQSLLFLCRIKHHRPVLLLLWVTVSNKHCENVSKRIMPQEFSIWMFLGSSH